MKPIISPRELAEAIGVSESSLKRWADDGLITVSRTAGGHRRIAIGEAIRFVRKIHAPLVRPELLGLTDLSARGDDLLSGDDPAERLLAHLRDGNAREARGLVLSMYLAGRSVAEIADGPIHTAMERLGELWRHDEAGIFIEHRATDLCVQAVQQLRVLVEPQGPGPGAVGGAPPGDPYILPTLLAATALDADGWRAVNLGPDTPFEALAQAIERHDARLAWLCVSSIRAADEVDSGARQLAALMAHRGGLLVLGGRAAADVAVPDLPGLRHGASLQDLVAIAAGMHSAAA